MVKKEVIRRKTTAKLSIFAEEDSTDKLKNSNDVNNKKNLRGPKPGQDTPTSSSEKQSPSTSPYVQKENSTQNSTKTKSTRWEPANYKVKDMGGFLSERLRSDAIKSKDKKVDVPKKGAREISKPTKKIGHRHNMK